MGKLYQLASKGNTFKSAMKKREAEKLKKRVEDCFSGLHLVPVIEYHPLTLVGGGKGYGSHSREPRPSA